MVKKLTFDVAQLEEIIAPELVVIEQNAVGQEYDYWRGYSQARKDIWESIKKIISHETKKEDLNWSIGLLKNQIKKTRMKDWREFCRARLTEAEAARRDLYD